MTGFPRSGTLAAIGAVAVLSAACTFSIDTGADTATKDFDVESFSEVAVAQAFEATITVGDETSVEVEIDEDLLDDVEVSVDGDRLTVELTKTLVTTNGPMRVRITTPQLSALDVGGAARVDLNGLNGGDFDLDIDGAASLDAEGSIDELSLEADGATRVDLDDTEVGTATVDMNGASNVSLANVAEVTGSVSGVSSLDIPEPNVSDIDKSGVASVN